MSVDPFVLSAVFSDESPLFRSPCEPDPGDTVTVRLRVAKDSAARVMLLIDSMVFGMLMTKARSDMFFDYYEAFLVCNRKEIIYRFLIEFVKNDQVEFEANMALNMGQLLSIPFILLGIGFLVYAFVKKLPARATPQQQPGKPAGPKAQTHYAHPVK